MAKMVPEVILIMVVHFEVPLNINSPNKMPGKNVSLNRESVVVI